VRRERVLLLRATASTTNLVLTWTGVLPRQTLGDTAKWIVPKHTVLMILLKHCRGWAYQLRGQSRAIAHRVVREQPILTGADRQAAMLAASKVHVPASILIRLRCPALGDHRPKTEVRSLYHAISDPGAINAVQSDLRPGTTITVPRLISGAAVVHELAAAATPTAARPKSGAGCVEAARVDVWVGAPSTCDRIPELDLARPPSCLL
jgi:hypothetical protein